MLFLTSSWLFGVLLTVDREGVPWGKVLAADVVSLFLSCRACLKRDRPVRFLCSGKPVEVDFAIGAAGGRGAVIGRSWTSLTKSRPGKGAGEDADADADADVGGGWVGDDSLSSGTFMGKRSPTNCIARCVEDSG